jgi:hypothetical protein
MQCHSLFPAYRFPWWRKPLGSNISLHWQTNQFLSLSLSPRLVQHNDNFFSVNHFAVISILIIKDEIINITQSCCLVKYMCDYCINNTCLFFNDFFLPDGLSRKGPELMACPLFNFESLTIVHYFVFTSTHPPTQHFSLIDNL